MPNTLIIVVAALYLLFYLLLCLKTKKPVRTAFLPALTGIMLLTVINLSSAVTGFGIPINAYTVATATALGMPGTVGLLLLRIIFI